MKIKHYIVTLIFCCLVFSCSKELPEGDYTGKFWGEQKINEFYCDQLDVPLELTSSTGSTITFNDTIQLTVSNDTVQGTIYLPCDYKIHPYIIGVSKKEKFRRIISGTYAAIRGDGTGVEGEFEIRRNW